VALARLALSGAAPLWLLDEPFDALDTDGITALNAVIASHAQAGGCVLLTSHQALSITDPAPGVLDLEPYAPRPRPRAAPDDAHHVADR
jgi:heme exporter protein A